MDLLPSKTLRCPVKQAEPDFKINLFIYYITLYDVLPKKKPPNTSAPNASS